MFHYEYLLQLNNYKILYGILDKEIKNLWVNGALTKSGAKKREKIPALKAKQKSIKKEFDILAQAALDEIENFNFPPKKKFYADIIKMHYCDFTKPYDGLLADIMKCEKFVEPSNFKADLQKLWARQF